MPKFVRVLFIKNLYQKVPSFIRIKQKRNNMRIEKLIIQGDPIALARARFGLNGVYDSQKHRKLVYGMEIAKQYTDKSMFEGAIELGIIFFMPVPYGFRRKKEQIIGVYHKTRPDLSNMIKWVEDVATGICYLDDAIISRIVSDKVYDLIPRTEITIREL